MLLLHCSTAQLLHVHELSQRLNGALLLIVAPYKKQKKRVKSISRWKTNNSCALALSREKLFIYKCFRACVYVCVFWWGKGLSGAWAPCAPLAPSPKIAEHARARQPESKFYSSYMKCGPPARPPQTDERTDERLNVWNCMTLDLEKNTQLTRTGNILHLLIEWNKLEKSARLSL